MHNLPLQHIYSHWILIFLNFCTFWRLKFPKSTKFGAPKMEKMAILQLGKSPKLISRKIRVIEKSWNFHIVKLTWLWQNTLRKLFVFGHLHFYLQNKKWQKVWQWWHYRFCFSCNPDSRKSNRFWLFSFVWCHDFRHWSRRHFEL